MVTLYENPQEEKIHHSAIAGIAYHFHLDELTIKRLYEEELARLKSHAKVKKFLCVLTARHVEEGLRKYVSTDLETGFLHH